MSSKATKKIPSQQAISPAPATGPIRINKAIAGAGFCSRRKADELIAAGKVTLNGRTVDEPGVKVDPATDILAVDGQEIRLAPDERPLVLMLHKPIEVVTTAKDPEGRKTVLDLLPKDLVEKRPFPVGRLDYYSEGLLLLTTDGDLAYRLTHPKWHQPKLYQLRVRGEVSPETIQTMENGMRLAEGETIAPIKIRVVRTTSRDTVLELTLIQGINRQIRRMCRDLGLTVLRLQRVALGPLQLGKLPSGKWRELSPEEYSALRKAVGLQS